MMRPQALQGDTKPQRKHWSESRSDRGLLSRTELLETADAHYEPLCMVDEGEIVNDDPASENRA